MTDPIRRQSAQTKVKLLAHGVQDPGDFVHLRFKEEHFAYDNGNWGVEAGRLFPSEIMLPGDIVCKIHVRPNSPLRLRRDGEGWVIEDNNRVLSTATLLPRPRFWDFETRNGVPTKKLAHFYGLSCLNFNIFSDCQFFDVGKQCGFCGVRATQQMHGVVHIRKGPEDLADVARLATMHDPVIWFLMTGGSYLHGDREFDASLAVIRAVRVQLPWEGRLRGNVSMMPPRDHGRLVELFELGVDSPSFNLEVWPREAFERVCPGKAAYRGWDEILLAYDELVRFYGPGSAWCNFVAGLVPLSDLKDGFTAMAERGVVPGANVYHPDVGSTYGNSIASPDEGYIVELYQHAAQLYRKHNFRPFFDSSVLRNSLANEAYEGLL